MPKTYRFTVPLSVVCLFKRGPQLCSYCLWHHIADRSLCPGLTADEILQLLFGPVRRIELQIEVDDFFTLPHKYCNDVPTILSAYKKSLRGHYGCR
jgi:hypothetical protein